MHGTYNISGLIVNVGLNALWSHPSYGNPLLTLTLASAIVVSVIHIFCQSKISHFYHSIHQTINPSSFTDTR